MEQLLSSHFDVQDKDDEDVDGEDLDLSAGDNRTIGTNPETDNQLEQSSILSVSPFFTNYLEQTKKLENLNCTTCYITNRPQVLNRELHIRLLGNLPSDDATLINSCIILTILHT